MQAIYIWTMQADGRCVEVKLAKSKQGKFTQPGHVKESGLVKDGPEGQAQRHKTEGLACLSPV